MPRKSPAAAPAPPESDRGKAVSLWLDDETLRQLDALGAAEAARSGGNPSRQRSPVVRQLVRAAYRAASARTGAGSAGGRQ